jgi:hypothetical protein
LTSGTKKSYVCEVDFARAAPGLAAHRMAATKMIRDFEDGKAAKDLTRKDLVALAEKLNVVTALTSMVAVAEGNNQAAVDALVRVEGNQEAKNTFGEKGSVLDEFNAMPEQQVARGAFLFDSYDSSTAPQRNRSAGKPKSAKKKGGGGFGNPFAGFFGGGSSGGIDVSRSKSNAAPPDESIDQNWSHVEKESKRRSPSPTNRRGLGRGAAPRAPPLLNSGPPPPPPAPGGGPPPPPPAAAPAASLMSFNDGDDECSCSSEEEEMAFGLFDGGGSGGGGDNSERLKKRDVSSRRRSRSSLREKSEAKPARVKVDPNARPLDKVILLQQFDGSWDDLNLLAAALGLDAATLKSAEEGLDEKLWVTALALAALQVRFAAEKVEWKLLAKKGNKFLGARMDLVGLAVEILK